MINTIISILLVILFIFLGQITYAIRKIITIILSFILNILSLFGIHIARKEKIIKTSAEFKNVYKDIKMVKLSNKNLKSKSSIDWFSLSIFLIALILVIVNFNSISSNVISNWIYSWVKYIGVITSPSDMNVFYTAALFSVISFSLSKLLNRWKETKQKRKEKKILKLKTKAIKEMTSKELLDACKEKDAENYKELK